MTDAKEILAGVPGGRVLDVATGSGGFIHLLLEGLEDYSEIIGVDHRDRVAAAFNEAFGGNPKIHFQLMDAARLEFDDASFDLVCISNSLHHLDPGVALREMMRVLRRGGHLLVSEMYRDGQTETQMTHVHLHHWWGAVDMVNGVFHRETYTRAELIGMLEGLGLECLRTFDMSDLSEDPRNPAILAELTPVFERYICRAEGHPDLQARGEELRRRVVEIGLHGATALVAIGWKSQPRGLGPCGTP